jgi:hypothetical protein
VSITRKQRAINGIRANMDARLIHGTAANNDVRPSGMELTEFVVTEEHGLTFVRAELNQGTFGTLLHAFSHEYWFFQIGERGAVTVLMYPEHMRQFKGKRYFGWSVK